MACATLKRSLESDPAYTPHPTKRRRYFAAENSPSKSSSSRATSSSSPFADAASRLTQDSISANIKEEMRRLHHRRQLHFDCESDSSSLGGNDLSLDGSGRPLTESKDKALFTFLQVEMICDRMLREQEKDLREMYEKALNAKLAEQYDMFVKFSNDQIQKRFAAKTEPSYLS